MANVDKAIRFLKLWSPKGPWSLVAIHPNGGKIVGKVFYPRNEDDARNWLSSRVDTFNLYFTVNDVPPGVKAGKPAKDDIARIRGLHVDVDAHTGDLANDLPPIEKLLREFPIPPTAIIFTGGGYQGFWKLRSRIDVPEWVWDKKTGTEPDEVKTLEAVNGKLERLCGMRDGTGNIDRIMRLPGTTNYPSAKKRKAGRTTAETKLVHFDAKAIYNLSDFDDIPNIPKIAEWWLGPLLVTNRRPDRDDYPSDSEASFAAIAEMKRSGMDRDEAEALITDERFGISAHALGEKDPNRSFNRAWDDARLEGAAPASNEELDEVIERLNAEFVQSFDGGLHQIMQMTPTSEEGPYRFLAPASFRAMKEGIDMVNVGKKSISTADYWLDHPQRRTVQGIVFAPARDVPGYYNLWRGWALEPLAKSNMDAWSLFREHVYDNVCGGDFDLYDYYMSWWAHKLQHPERKIGAAIILRGKEGTGKTVTAQAFQRIIGPHMLKVNDVGQVLGRFNGSHASLLVLHSEESFWAGDKKMEGKLKDIITSDTQQIEFKGKEPKQMKNYYDLYVTGNPDWVVPASLDARRFAVYEIGNTRAKDSKFFSAIRKSMWEGEAIGCRALMRYLLDYRITRELKNVPVTAALVKQKELSMSADLQLLLELAYNGSIPGSEENPAVISTERLFAEYIAYCDSLKVMHGRKGPRYFGREVHKLGVIKRQRTNGKRYYIFPPLKEYRANFSRLLGLETKWGSSGDWSTNMEDGM